MPSIHSCQAVVTVGSAYDSLLAYLKNPVRVGMYEWFVSSHYMPATEDNCHEVIGSHHHWIIWWNNELYFNDVPICSFLKRSAGKWISNGSVGRYYNDQRVKNLSGMMLYMQEADRSIVWKDSAISLEKQEYFENVMTSKGKKRMHDYVEARDAKKAKPMPKEKISLFTIVDVVKKDGAFSYESWADNVFRLHPDGSDERQMYLRIASHPQGERWIKATNLFMKKHVENMTWRQSLESQEGLLKLKIADGEYMSIPESKNWIRRILKFNGYTLNSFCEDVNAIMTKEWPKINTLFLQGPSNAGKSKLARSIVEGFLTHGQTTRSETFMFQDCCDQQCILIEEMRICQENVDDVKRLFEGSKMKVDIKNKDPRELKRTPVVACSNTPPGRWVCDETQALHNRMKIYNLQEFENLRNMTGDITPLAWLEFMRQLDDTESNADTKECSAEWESDEEIGEPQATSTPKKDEDETVEMYNADTVEAYSQGIRHNRKTKKRGH